MEASAKGSAKTVCESLTNDPHFVSSPKDEEGELSVEEGMGPV